ncbi:uncharacterized protein LOC116127296 [Pistacia vera]|uniref:uncharacterized protein LOC116127296 n=1 Tax=Pistacia vera TaxID=55513 RepID=UPI001263D7A3|nr:uncharacterized protein LOC116127296 [Pistacia vera]
MSNILLYLIRKYPGLATAKDDDGRNILDALALRPWDFQSGSNLGFWKKWIYNFVPVKFKLTTPRSERVGVYHFPVSSTTYRVVGWPEKLLWNCIGLLAPGIKEVHDAKLTHKFALELVKSVVVAFSPLSDSQIYEFFLQSDIITKAASSGIVEIVKICLQMVPDIFWLSTDQQTLLKVAVQYRQEKILTLVHNTVVYNKFTSPKPIDEFKNSILHLAARLAPPHYLRVVSGAALQMQREVQWFKEVEKLVHPFLKEMPNSDGKTAQVVFTEQHKAMDEKYIKFLHGCHRAHCYTRYAEEDFLESLPKRLITGLASLFLAIANMMIAFAAAFAVALRETSIWVAIAVPFVASLPDVLKIQSLTLFNN